MEVLRTTVSTLGCADCLSKINDLKTKLETAKVGIQKDLKAVEKDISDLDRTTEGIQSDSEAAAKRFLSRAWAVVEKAIGVLIGIGVAYVAIKLGLPAP